MLSEQLAATFFEVGCAVPGVACCGVSPLFQYRALPAASLWPMHPPMTRSTNAAFALHPAPRVFSEAALRLVALIVARRCWGTKGLSLCVHVNMTSGFWVAVAGAALLIKGVSCVWDS